MSRRVPRSGDRDRGAQVPRRISTWTTVAAAARSSAAGRWATGGWAARCRSASLLLVVGQGLPHTRDQARELSTHDAADDEHVDGLAVVDDPGADALDVAPGHAGHFHQRLGQGSARGFADLRDPHQDSIEGFCAPPPAATVCPRMADRGLRLAEEVAEVLSVAVIHRGSPLRTRPSRGWPRGARSRRPRPPRDPGDPRGRAGATVRLRGFAGRLASVTPSRRCPSPAGSRHGQPSRRRAVRRARSVGRCASRRCGTGG